MEGKMLLSLLLVGLVAATSANTYQVSFDKFLDGNIEFLKALRQALNFNADRVETEVFGDLEGPDFTMEDIQVSDMTTVVRTGPSYQTIAIQGLNLTLTLELGLTNMTLDVAAVTAPITAGKRLENVRFLVGANSLREVFSFAADAATNTCTMENSARLVTLDQVTMVTQDGASSDVSAFFRDSVVDAFNSYVNDVINPVINTYNCKDNYLTAFLLNYLSTPRLH